MLKNPSEKAKEGRESWSEEGSEQKASFRISREAKDEEIGP